MDELSSVQILDTMQLQGDTWMFIAWYSWLTVLVGTLPIFLHALGSVILRQLS
jgi:hypothetical protein